MDYIRNPQQIEKRSMEIVEEHLGRYSFDRFEKAVAKRVVHTTGDPSFAGIIAFNTGAAESGARTLAGGGRLHCDVEMVRAGINRRLAEVFGLTISCRIHDTEIAAVAKSNGSTRAAAAMSLAMAEQPENGIFVIGNAPTALFVLLEAAAAGKVRPALVIGTPVGFVGAAESKEWLTTFDFPWITIRGEKGGSTVAAAAVNALLITAS
ncbi:MAG: precorrin-8X methylmutase [Dethiobacter sp.]|jgi:precorrin-8X/cobalt-precorrin-8 methylmutase|nr:precorrin-8X methylmutase [Dethiobacter sp.]